MRLLLCQCFPFAFFLAWDISRIIVLQWVQLLTKRARDTLSGFILLKTAWCVLYWPWHIEPATPSCFYYKAWGWWNLFWRWVIIDSLNCPFPISFTMRSYKSLPFVNWNNSDSAFHSSKFFFLSSLYFSCLSHSHTIVWVANANMVFLHNKNNQKVLLFLKISHPSAFDFDSTVCEIQL